MALLEVNCLAHTKAIWDIPADFLVNFLDDMNHLVMAVKEVHKAHRKLDNSDLVENNNGQDKLRLDKHGQGSRELVKLEQDKVQGNTGKVSFHKAHNMAKHRVKQVNFGQGKRKVDQDLLDRDKLARGNSYLDKYNLDQGNTGSIDPASKYLVDPWAQDNLDQEVLVGSMDQAGKLDQEVKLDLVDHWGLGKFGQAN